MDDCTSDNLEMLIKIANRRNVLMTCKATYHTELIVIELIHRIFDIQGNIELI